MPFAAVGLLLRLVCANAPNLLMVTRHRPHPALPAALPCCRRYAGGKLVSGVENHARDPITVLHEE
jgi:hypothetical protein